MADLQEVFDTRLPTLQECVTEGWDCFGMIPAFSFLIGRDSEGTLWNPVGYGQPTVTNALLHFFRTATFWRLQMWQSDWLFKTNGYALSSVENLANMILGQGLDFKADNKSYQRELDRWMRKNKFKKRSREAFIKTLVRGEAFFRITDDGDHGELRDVAPELVWDAEHLGIITNETDYETVEAYVVSGQRVSPDQIQHRKLAFCEEKRGTSILFPIAQHLINAEQLLHNLTRSADVQSKFAAIREHQGNQAAVQTFQSGIQAQPINQRFIEPVNRERIEHYEAGTILDLPTSVKMMFPSAAIDAEKYIAVLRAVLRLCAARVGLPENVLSQDQDSMGAYKSSLVNDGHCCKGMEIWQQRLIDWDLELLEQCGFDIDKINVVAPEVATRDKNELVSIGQFLKAAKLASNSTIAKSFEIDYMAELEAMKQEPKDEPAPEAPMPQNNSEKEPKQEPLDKTSEPDQGADAA